jgi:tetratricopeptide (TPR) repeat protein
MGRAHEAKVAVAALIAVLIALAGPARGDDKKRAAKLYDLAAELFVAKQYAEAAKLFAESFALDPLPSALFNQARCLEESGQREAAIVAFRGYLEADPRGAGVAEAQSRMLAMERELEAERRVKEREAEKRRREQEAKRRAEAGPETVEVSVDRGATLRLAGYITAGAGVGMLAAGIGFGIRARGLDRELSEHDGGWTDTELDKESSGILAERLQIGFLVAGGVAVAAGTALGVVGLMRSDVVEVRPVVSKDTAGASVSVAF